MYLDDKLELLDTAADYFRGTSLSDAYLIACQHILPSTHRMLLKLMELGLKKKNIALIGKCYSTSDLAARNLVDSGIRVDASSGYYDGHRPFDEYFQAHVRRFLREQIERLELGPQSRILLLDDGGELLKIANQTLAGFTHVLGIEQTSSGFNKLKSSGLNFPIVNVARSKGKLQLETPMIADSQIRTVARGVLARAKPTDKILILGNGYIGAALRERLRRRFASVDVWDLLSRVDPAAPRAAALGEYDIIIGATGTTSLPVCEHGALKSNVVLISASTSDREFDAFHLRRRLPASSDCHADLQIDGITLVNSGFPVNFYGSEFDNVPLPDIQLTFALLLGGVCQARPRENGFVDLDERFQDVLFRVWRKRAPISRSRQRPRARCSSTPTRTTTRSRNGTCKTTATW